MTSRGAERVLRVGADIRGALSALDRLQDRGRRVARQLNNVGAGVPGAAIGGAGRLGGGAGRTLLAGAGIGGGLAVIERLFESLFELFEDTDVLKSLQAALTALFRAVAPLAGVLIGALVEPLKALTPVLAPLARAIAPVVELLGGALTATFLLLGPIVIKVAEGLELVTTKLRDGVLWILRQIVDLVNRIPGVSIDLPRFQTGTYDTVSRDLAATQARKALEEAAKGEGRGGQRSAGGGAAAEQDGQLRAIGESIARSQLESLLASAERRGQDVRRGPYGPQPAPGSQAPPPLTAYITVEVPGAAVEQAVKTVATRQREYTGR